MLGKGKMFAKNGKRRIQVSYNKRTTRRGLVNKLDYLADEVKLINDRIMELGGIQDETINKK